jgi:dextranase
MGWAGGFHLLLGEANGAVCDPQYPKYATLRPEFVPVMRAYYDFTVRYENWLFDLSLALLPAED